MNSSAGLVSWRAAPGLWGKASGPLPLYFLIAGTVSRTYCSVEKEEGTFMYSGALLGFILSRGILPLQSLEPVLWPRTRFWR